jgi:mono/diheme cytochrome c family protein
LNCLFGGWGLSTGTAWWDDVSVIEVGAGGGAAVGPGQLERLAGRNLAHRVAADAQIDLIRRLADGDAGLAAVVLGGLAEGWSERDVPSEVGDAQRAALSGMVAKFAPASQSSLGAIVARWSGVVTAAAKPTGPSLPAEELKRFESGKARYSTLCIACHQPNGQGLAILAPSLVKSEWALGPASRPIRIVLNGLQGPITANGVKFESPAVMPPQKDVLDDTAIAEILTYVRNEWGNSAPPVQAADVKAVREAEAKRSALWTAPELLKVP